MAAVLSLGNPPTPRPGPEKERPNPQRRIEEHGVGWGAWGVLQKRALNDNLAPLHLTGGVALVTRGRGGSGPLRAHEMTLNECLSVCVCVCMGG